LGAPFCGRAGGAGGKGTWGTASQAHLAVALDRNDPNYDPDGDVVWEVTE